MKKSIVVCASGFVYIGILTGKKDDNGFLELIDASVIRRWGTTKGLGQIAVSGLQKETILDEEGTMYINLSHIYRITPCLW